MVEQSPQRPVARAKPAIGSARQSPVRGAQWQRLAVDGGYGISAPDLEAVTTRVERKTIEVRGSALCCASLGRGDPPFVLLHGLGGRWQHWLPVLAPLARARQVVAIDLPGFGESEPIVGRVSVDELVERVALALEQSRIEGAIVFGHSLVA